MQAEQIDRMYRVSETTHLGTTVIAARETGRTAEQGAEYVILHLESGDDSGQYIVHRGFIGFDSRAAFFSGDYFRFDPSDIRSARDAFAAAVEAFDTRS